MAKNDTKVWKRRYDESVVANNALKQKLVSADIPEWEARIAKAEAETERVIAQRNSANGKAASAAGKIKKLEALNDEHSEHRASYSATIKSLEADILKNGKETSVEIAHLDGCNSDLKAELEKSADLQARFDTIISERDHAKDTIDRMRPSTQVGARLITIFEQDGKVIGRDLTKLRQHSTTMSSDSRNQLANRLYDRMSNAWMKAATSIGKLRNLNSQVMKNLEETALWCSEKADAVASEEATEALEDALEKAMVSGSVGELAQKVIDSAPDESDPDDE